MVGRPLHAAVLPTGPALFEMLRAALDGGPALLPIDPDLPAPAVRRLLDALRPEAVVLPEGTRPVDGGEPVGDDIAAVIATSGSTGEPKGVELTAVALRHCATAALDRLEAASGDRWLCCLPPCHIGGIGVLMRSLVSETEPVLLDRFSVDAFGREAAEFTSVVPTILLRLLDAGVDLTGFRTVLVGGAPLPPNLRLRAEAAGVRVVSTYGMSETAGGCVYDGVPLTGVTVEIGADERVRIAGPVLAAGYRRRPDLSAEAFVDGWHVTADRGRLTPDGRLEVLGRFDDVIITGGVNVAASAVSDLLATHSGVAQAAAIGRPDERWGQRVVAVVVPVDSSAPPTLAQLREYVAARAASALAPRELILLDAMPILPSGKVDRRALLELTR